MNQCPPGSQGVRGQLSTGPSGPLDFEAVDRKEIFQPNFSYGVFLVHPAMGRLMRWDLGGQRYGESLVSTLTRTKCVSSRQLNNSKYYFDKTSTKFSYSNIG